MPFVSAEYLNAADMPTRRALCEEHTTFGWHPETGDTLFVPNSDRYAGTYILGVQGVGKSGLLEHLIAQDVHAGRAVIVIDPHGDLITNVIAALPPTLLGNAYLLDLEDELWPFGCNVFSGVKLATSVDVARSVDRLMHVFDVLWPDVLKQANLPRYVRAATLTLLANPGTTLVDMYRFLTDDVFRARLLQNVTDPTVAQFWRTQYERLSPDEQQTRIQALLTRLETLFMGRALVRNVVAQRRNSISFRQAMLNRELIFIRLPVKTIEQDARLIGTLLLTQIHSAIFSFGDLPPEQRPGVSLFVDEFAHFATADFNELFAEGRKFGARVTLAHQYRTQLPGFLQDATRTARTKICFQLTAADAREMAHDFPSGEITILPEDVSTDAVGDLIKHGSDHPDVQDFINRYLLPLAAQPRHKGQIEITSGGFSLRDAWRRLQAGDTLPTPLAVDPIPYLNALLRDVMRTREPRLPIPWQVVDGFGNIGKGFYVVARGKHHHRDLSEPVYPSGLMYQKGGREVWIQPPRSSREQYYHFLFSLRLTMRYVAAHPVGKATQTSAADVARMLASLPKRAAFVRSGDTVGVIYTHDTPERVSGPTLRQRLDLIRQQTRATYCHPRDDIEQGLAATTGNPAAPVPASSPAVVALSPWEEL